MTKWTDEELIAKDAALKAAKLPPPPNVMMTPLLTQTSERLSNCLRCEMRPEQDKIIHLCGKCLRETQILALPGDRRELYVSEIVPKRFREARKEKVDTYIMETIEAAGEELVYLWGKPGVGKSYAAAALCRDWLLSGWSVRRVVYDYLLLLIRDTFKNSGKQTELDVILPYMQADKLVIEDLGTTVQAGSRETDFSNRTFQLILDYRDENMLQTIITSNKPVDEIAGSFDTRTASRISRGAVLQLDGEDKRLSRKD